MKLPKIELNAPVIVSYTLLSFLVLMLNYLTGGWTNRVIFTCKRSGLLDVMMWVRMVSYVFGHSDLSHYIGNFFLITLLGPMVEEKYGSRRLLLMMLVTAVIGGAANLLLTHTGLIGASGIAFMLIILCSCTSVSSGSIPVTLLLMVVIYIGKEVVEGLAAKDHISHMTHILGGVCGLAFGLYFTNKRIAAQDARAQARRAARAQRK